MKTFIKRIPGNYIYWGSFFFLLLSFSAKGQLTCEPEADFTIAPNACQITYTATNNNSEAIHTWSTVGTITGQGTSTAIVDYPSGNHTYTIIHNIRIPNGSGGFDFYSCSKEVMVNCAFNCTELFTISQSSNACSIYQFMPTIDPSNIASYFWDFGDGSTSTASNPSHQFINSLLVYTVSLTITDNNGLSQTCAETIFIDCQEMTCGEISSFSYDSENCKATFYASDIPQIVSSIWDFGDGTTQNNGSTVSHAYTQPGVYTVTYTATYDDGSGPVVFSCSRIVTVTCACCPNPASVSIGNTSLLQLISNGDLPSGQVSDKEFCIETKLTINTGNYIFSNCTFNMAPGSEIVLTTGFGPGGSGTIRMENSSFSGCTQMWKGIKTNSGTSLIFRGNTVSDAQYAINGAAGSKITVIDNHFDRNFVSIHTEGAVKGEAYYNLHECTGDLLPPFIGQSPLPQTTRSYAGIELLNNDRKIPIRIGIVNSLAPAETFRFLHNGIVAEESGIDAGALRVEDMIAFAGDLSGYGVIANKCGVVSITGMDFSTNPSLPLAGELSKVSFLNCDYGGIWCLGNNNVAIRHNRMVNVGEGVHMEKANFGSTLIENNKISTSEQYRYIPSGAASGTGIVAYDNEFASQLSFNYNLFEVGESTLGTKGGDGIFMMDFTSFQHRKYLIKGNETYLYNNIGSHISGIRAEVDNLDIIENEVYIKNSIGSPGEAIGILLFGNRIGINENTIRADQYDKQLTGINSDSNNNGSYRCNDLKNTGIGMRFDGISMNAQIRANIFNRHHTALHYTANTYTSSAGNAHTHSGNKWLGFAYGGGNEAEHLGIDDNILLSQYIIHTTAGDYYPNPINTPNASPNSWFILEPGTPAPCNGIGPITPFTPMEQAVMEGTPLTTDFAQALLWSASKAVYDKIAQDTALLQQSVLATDFYTLNKNAAMGDFWNLEQDMASLNPLNEIEKDLIVQQSNVLFDLVDQIGQKTLALQNASGATIIQLENERESLIADFDSIYDNQQNLINFDIVMQNLLADSLALQNDAIVTSGAIYESNQKTVNAIYLATLAKGIREFTPQQEADLWAIANQCPYAGGRAVRQARGIYRLIDDAVYDDDLLCQIPENRLPADTGVPTEQSHLRLFPNPAQNSLFLNYQLPSKYPAILEIVNLQGQKILEQVLATEDQYLEIALDHFSSGIYFCKIHQNGQLLLSDKIVIQK